MTLNRICCYYQYSSQEIRPDQILKNKTDHVARKQGRKRAFRDLVVKVEEKRTPEVLSVNERIILKWIFKKWGMG
jgi:hypothetical protein